MARPFGLPEEASAPASPAPGRIGSGLPSEAFLVSPPEIGGLEWPPRSRSRWFRARGSSIRATSQRRADMRIGCVDFVSNTFFPATAAEELGCFAAEGVEAHVELLRTLVAFPALRDGEVEFLAAPAHSV